MKRPSEARRRAKYLLGARSTLALLTVLNLINYMDRYVLSAVLEHVKLDPAFAGVTDGKLGLLQSAFLIVYMAASPVAGVVGQRIPRRFVVAVGVGIWSLATIASGLARNYHEMVIARAFIGFGEAGYATVAPAMISDLFLRSKRARMMSVFFLATPVGSALGFILGGTVADAWSWRHAFFLCGGPGLLLALASLWMAEPQRGAQDTGAHKGSAPHAAMRHVSMLRQVSGLLRNVDFLQVTAGATLLSFSVGAIAFWVPTWLQEARHLGAARANQIFGGLAAVAGIGGTIAGGFIGDAWARKDPHGYLRVSGLGALVGAPFAAAAPFAGNLTISFALMAISMFFVFLSTGPLNTSLMNSTPPHSRELAIGLNILFIHLLGDAVSPPLLGALATSLHKHGQPAQMGLTVALATTALPFLLGAFVLLAPRWVREKRARKHGIASAARS